MHDGNFSDNEIRRLDRFAETFLQTVSKSKNKVTCNFSNIDFIIRKLHVIQNSNAEHCYCIKE